MFARPFIDSKDFARNGRELCGEIPIAELSRLGDILANSDGALSYKVLGTKEGDRLGLEIILKGTCHLRCQRCLGEFTYLMDSVAHFQLIPAEKLDEFEADEEDAIEASSQLDVLALVEDEVLLGLPFAPKHPDGACDSPLKDLKKVANPFAVLAALKNTI